MAETLMRQLGGDRYEVASAGTHPKAVVHPEALRTLERRHTTTDGLVPKDVSLLADQSFDYVITVCDRAQEQCPVFPGADMIHWSFPDPADAEPGAQARAFNEVYQGLAQRIRLLVVVGERK
jgi:protein-tyrosine-phosphatase